jgi:hypothetical protein
VLAPFVSRARANARRLRRSRAAIATGMP